MAEFERRASRRLAWALVYLYPPPFRRDLGLALVDAIDDAMQARRAAGQGVAITWLAAAADTVRNAPPEWLLAAAHRRQQPAPGGRTVLDQLQQDAKAALRGWRRRPGFAAVAVATLAVGIAATTAMFSIVNAVLLRPIPYANGDRLVMIWGRTPASPRGLVNYREFDAIRSEATAFDGVALWLSQSVNVTGQDEPQRIIGAYASGSLFDVLGLAAERGRLFSNQESEPGSAQPVVVITDAYWRRRFAADPSAIGSTLTLNGVPLTIIGVLRPPFDAASVPGGGWFLDCDALVPVGQFRGRNDLSGAGPSLIGVGRLKPNVSIAAANRELDLVAERTQAAFPSTEAGRSTEAVSVQETIVGASRQTLLLLLGSVCAVLLIACVNVGNLLLARAVDRQTEMAVRAALGASRLMVARQLIVESALLTAVSTAAGVLAGRWSLALLSWLEPPSVPIPDHIPLDGRIVLFTVAVSALVALVCGVAPSLKAARLDLNAALAVASRGSTGNAGRTRDALVLVELALSVALLATSGLLVRSLVAVQHVSIGFDPANVLTLQFRLPPSRYATKAQIARFFKQAIERVREVPGVESAALARAVPFSGNAGTTTFVAEGHPAVPGAEPQASYHLVTPDYFRTLRIPLLRGRDFTDRDDLQAPLVAVVNDTLARTMWPGEDPIGKRIRTPDLDGWISVVGVVADAKHAAATDPPRPQLYVSHYQNPQIFSSLVARTAAAPMGVANDVRRAIWSVDKDQPVWAVQPLDAIVAKNQGQWRFMAILSATFAAVAVLLAGIGIYGVMAYSVAERTHEIGVRLALGASSSRVLGEIVARGLRLTGIALAVGVAAAIAAARLASGVLFGVTPYDPITIGAAAVVLGAVAIVACIAPARRAARVSPVEALAD